MITACSFPHLISARAPLDGPGSPVGRAPIDLGETTVDRVDRRARRQGDRVRRRRRGAAPRQRNAAASGGGGRGTRRGAGAIGRSGIDSIARRVQDSEMIRRFVPFRVCLFPFQLIFFALFLWCRTLDRVSIFFSIHSHLGLNLNIALLSLRSDYLSLSLSLYFCKTLCVSIAAGADRAAHLGRAATRDRAVVRSVLGGQRHAERAESRQGRAREPRGSRARAGRYCWGQRER